MTLRAFLDSLIGAVTVIAVMLLCIVFAVLLFVLRSLWAVFTLPARLLERRP